MAAKKKTPALRIHAKSKDEIKREEKEYSQNDTSFENNSRIFHWRDLTASELRDIPRNKTVIFWSISPLEVHGPHLPLGCDPIIAEEMAMRAAKKLLSLHEDYHIIFLPTLHAGSDTLPLSGSIHISDSAIQTIILDTVSSLSKLGFKYLLISNNHGGPRHGFNLEMTARAAFKKYKMIVLSPFAQAVRLFDQNNKQQMRAFGIDNQDEEANESEMHAGHIETSIMLAAQQYRVRSLYQHLPVTQVSSLTSPIKKMLKKVTYFLALFPQNQFFEDIKTDVNGLATALGWVNLPEVYSYMGAPSLASKEKGEKILEWFADRFVDLLEASIQQNRPVKMLPPLWYFRALRHLPL